MDTLTGLDWTSYLRGLSDEEMYELATWLVAERLEVGEFIEVVDREYAQISDEWRKTAPDFVTQFGRPGASAYARRKRRFAALMGVLEEARMAGALPGDVAPEELKPSLAHRMAASSVSMTKALTALKYVRGDWA